MPRRRPGFAVQPKGALNAAAPVPRDDYFPQRDLSAPLDVERFSREVLDRRTWAVDKLSKGEFVDATGAPLSASQRAILDHEVALASARPELRVALADTVIHCAPMPESRRAWRRNVSRPPP